MDLVYPLSRGYRRAELRYSLRAADANLPHARVWVVSRSRPAWASDLVGHVVVDDRSTKWRNLPRAILAACEHSEVSREFVLMNDDFFIVSPIGAVEVLHRGPLEEAKGYEKGYSSYARGFKETERALRALGVDGPLLNYELHLPMPVDGDRMGAALRDALALVRGRDATLHARTLYANLWHLGGRQTEDVKVHGEKSELGTGPFVSTNDRAFDRAPIGRMLRSAYPEPCRYEKSEVQT